ncbi:MAG TPA: hypothetical protein VNH11_32225 [Pirellulales bacterium]|nr:hypothetical protein [Pirellulales bacterium]
MSLRAVSVVVAVTHNQAGWFFVSYNDRWSADTFPMRKPRPGEKLEDVAVQAFLDHGPPVAPRVKQPLMVVAAYDTSDGTSEPTYYRYHVFEVELGRPLPSADPAGAYHFLSLPDLLTSPTVSWSAKEIARALVDPSYVQRAAVAIVCRRGPVGREFLVVPNAGYGDVFFPAARPRFEELPEQAAERALRDDTGYDGRVQSTLESEAELRQFSQRYQVDRDYHFYLCKVSLPGVDLRASGNALEAKVKAFGMPWRWVPESELQNLLTHGLTPTVGDLGPHVLAAAGDCE